MTGVIQLGMHASNGPCQGGQDRLPQAGSPGGLEKLWRLKNAVEALLARKKSPASGAGLVVSWGRSIGSNIRRELGQLLVSQHKGGLLAFVLLHAAMETPRGRLGGASKQHFVVIKSVAAPRRLVAVFAAAMPRPPPPRRPPPPPMLKDGPPTVRSRFPAAVRIESQTGSASRRCTR